MDESGREQPHDQPGEICLRGGSVMSGYWGRPDATRDALREGWLYTGDIGALSREGGLKVFDRRSDLIVSEKTSIPPKSNPPGSNTRRSPRRVLPPSATKPTGSAPWPFSCRSPTICPTPRVCEHTAAPDSRVTSVP